MKRNIFFLSAFAAAVAAALAACSASSKHDDIFGSGGAASADTSTSTSTGTSTEESAASGLGGNFMAGSGMPSSTGSGMCNSGPNDDQDKDGWTPAQGDCNDCDPNVNPGAIEVATTPDADGGPGVQADEDCDGMVDNVPGPCDNGLALDDTNPIDGAKAIELCQTAKPNDKKWGVLSASYVRADGSVAQLDPTMPQVGLQSTFGPNVNAQGGKRMLLLSAGTARTPGQPGECGSESCFHTPGVAPPGFPQDVPGCSGSTEINDDIALDLKIRAPTNATGYKVDFKFYSFEFPYWVCSSFNDQFIALVNPPPKGAINGNIAFDSMKNPVSVNIGFFDVCDPNSVIDYEATCPGCKPTPNPYCPSGTGQLQGTGFDVWAANFNGYIGGGGTSWLETQAPITGGTEFDIRFAIWNTGDEALFSSVLVDNFQWIANGGTVTVGTDPVTNPK